MGWSDLDAYARSRGVRIGAPSPGQTVGGTHADGSYHYRGLARDYGSESDAAAVERLFTPLAIGANAPIVELFGIGGTSYKDGKALSPIPAGHVGSHTHVAMRPGAKLNDGGNSSVAGNVAGAVGGAVSLNPGAVLDNLGGLAGNATDAVPGLDALGSIASTFASLAAFLAARGRFLVLAGGGLLLCIAGFVLLARDLALGSVVPKLGRAK